MAKKLKKEYNNCTGKITTDSYESCLDSKDDKGAEVYYLSWTEHDRWSGPSNDGYTLHLSKQDMGEYLRDWNKQREKEYKENKGITPECYSNPESNSYKIIYISGPKLADLRRSKQMGKLGIHFYDKLEIKIVAK